MTRRTIQYNPTGNTYCFNVTLVSNSKDIGFFDTYTLVTGGTITGGTAHEVTGYSISRLSELRKYVTTGILSDLYTTSTEFTTDGLNVDLSVSGSTYVYYIGGITYTDLISSGFTITFFTFQSLGLYDPNNFEDKPYVKLEEKQNIVENPIITNDVKVVRQEIPVFDQLIRLRAVEKINDIVVYGGGSVFTIHNNT